MLKKAREEAKADGRRRSEGAKDASDAGKDFAQGIRDSSRQIWLAGLGAFSRAQAEGMKVFEALVEQGQNLESRTRRAASETATAAAGMAAQKAKEVQQKAGGTWDKLEQVFEDRVARALSKLGVHTQADVERLSKRVETLAEAVNALLESQGRQAVAPARKASARKRPAQPRAAAVGASTPDVKAPRERSKKSAA